MFLSAPAALESANITNNPAAPAPVLLAHLPGRYYLSVRALKPDAHVTLNVILKNRTYIIRFVVSEKPYGSVTFYEERPVNIPHSPKSMLALLDRAKSYRLIQDQFPEAVQYIELRAPVAPDCVAP